MKNVDEVAVIDLGRPSSTQSQISIDEPDAPYLRCGRAIVPQQPVGIYNRPLLDPILDFSDTRFNHNPKPDINMTNVNNAKTELNANIVIYKGNYETLRDNAAAVNTYIYSNQQLNAMFSTKASFLDTQRPIVKPNPMTGNMEPYDESPSSNLCYWGRPFNFYQAQCVNIAQNINEINRNAEIRRQITDQVGHAVLSMFADCIRQIQKRISDVKFWVHSTQFQTEKVKDNLNNIERIFGNLFIKPPVDNCKPFKAIYAVLGAFSKNYASDERFKRMLVAKIIQEIDDSKAVTATAVEVINKQLTPAFLLYVSQSAFQDVFLQKSGRPVNVSSDVFMHYALHKEKMTTLGFNRNDAVQPELAASESLEEYADAADAQLINKRRWDIQNAVRSIQADIQTLNDPATPPAAQPGLVDNIRKELVNLTRVYNIRDESPVKPGYVTEVPDLSQFIAFMKRQIEASDLLDTACDDFKKATDDFKNATNAVDRSAADLRRSDANTNFDQAVIQVTSIIVDLQKYANDQVGNKYNQLHVSRLQDLYDINTRLPNDLYQSDVDGLQNYFVISSPTGTGKTVQYMLYTHALKRNVGIGTHTLIFTNNSSNCKQVFDTFRSGLAERVTFVKIATENVTGVPGVPGELCFVILTSDDDYADMTKPFNYSKIVIPIKDVEPYDTKIINGTSYAYQSRQYSNDMCTKRLQGYFGGVVIAPLFLYDSLFSLGVLDDYQRIQSVVFDEVDVFYNLQSIPEFQQFFFQHPSIYRAAHVIFCSATIEPEFINRYDSELSQYTNTLFWKQYYLNTGIQDSTNTVKQSFILPQTQLGAPIKTSIDNSVSKYIYINHGEYVKITPDDYEIHRQYGVFKGINYNTQQLIERILNYYPQAILSNKPLYTFKQKDLFRYNYYFLLPINDLKPLISIKSLKVAPDDAANKAFRDQLYNETRNSVVKSTCKELVSWNDPNPIPGGQDNDKEYRIDPADATKYKIDEGMMPIANSKTQLYVDFLLQGIYDVQLTAQQTALNTWKALPPGDPTIPAQIAAAGAARLQLQNLSRSDVSLAKSLVLYFDSLSGVYRQLRYDNTGARIMFDVLRTTESVLPALNEKVFNPTTPFYDKLITGIMRQLDIESYYNLMEADFLEGGRGLDINALVRVYIVLPMYIGLKDRGLNYRTIKQAAGRVGRAGAVGIAIITRYMYIDCYTLDTYGKKIVDNVATQELGGQFDVWEVDVGQYNQMVADIKSIGTQEFNELGQMYDQLGFQGFKQNVQLVDYLEQQLNDYYKP